MEQYSQLQAYKHILGIAENILYSVHLDESLVDKYERLKQAVISKTSSGTGMQSYFSRKLLQSYKNLLANTITSIGEFENQLECEMQRTSYNHKIIQMNNNFLRNMEELNQSLSHSRRQSDQDHKERLLQKQQISNLKYLFEELDGKMENLGLTIEVHAKMHQIICQASQNQQQRNQKQILYQTELRNYEEQVCSIRDAKIFIERHRLAEQQLKKVKIFGKELQTLLHKGHKN